VRWRRRELTLERTAVRKVILMMSVSLDGFIEGPDRQLDWHMVDNELHSHFDDRPGTRGVRVGNSRLSFQRPV
jgi:hypothetical protein